MSGGVLLIGDEPVFGGAELVSFSAGTTGLVAEPDEHPSVDEGRLDLAVGDGEYLTFDTDYGRGGSRFGLSSGLIPVDGAAGEGGGQVLRTVDASEIRRRERAVVEGRVEHRDTGEPLVGAVVFLSGTQYRGVTDANGFYRLEDVRPGTYPLVYRHAALDSLGTFAWPVEVELQAGEVLTTTLHFPPGEARR